MEVDLELPHCYKKNLMDVVATHTYFLHIQQHQTTLLYVLCGCKIFMWMN